MKDNDFIYHEVVPELVALPEVKGLLTIAFFFRNTLIGVRVSL